MSLFKRNQQKGVKEMPNVKKSQRLNGSGVRQVSSGANSRHSTASLRHPKFEHVTVSLELIGPAEAAELLEGNIQNRKKKQPRIEEYARSMESDTWNEQNLSQIVVDINGRLKNGQNRMKAVIKSGKSYWFLVVRGVNADVMTSLDTGTSRTLSDVLDIRGGYKATSALAAAIRCCSEYERRGRKLKGHDQSRYSYDEALDFLDAHPELPELTLWSKNLHGRMKGMQKVVAGSDVALFNYALITGGAEQEDVIGFFEALAGLKPASGAILVLQSKLQDMNQERLSRGTSYTRDFVMAILVKAWNAFITGQEVKRIGWKPGGDRPEKFPVLIFRVD